MILMIRLELFIQQTYEWIFSLILMVLLSIYWPCMLFTHDCIYLRLLHKWCMTLLELCVC